MCLMVYMFSKKSMVFKKSAKHKSPAANRIAVIILLVLSYKACLGMRSINLPAVFGFEK
jgi:hypothetical protein